MIHQLSTRLTAFLLVILYWATTLSPTFWFQWEGGRDTNWFPSTWLSTEENRRKTSREKKRNHNFPFYIIINTLFSREGLFLNETIDSANQPHHTKRHSFVRKNRSLPCKALKCLWCWTASLLRLTSTWRRKQATQRSQLQLPSCDNQTVIM